MNKENKSKQTVVIFAPGSAYDGGWSESAIQAGRAIENENWQAQSYANVTHENAVKLIHEISRKESALFIGHGCEFIDAFMDLASVYPNSHFFVMDKVSEPHEWPTNYSCLFQKQFEAIYLAGYLAGCLTRNRKIGFVSGMKVPTQIANAAAFSKGAKDKSGDIVTEISFAGSFVDPELGREIALKMIDQGVDVIMQSASETGNGVIEACNEKGIQLIGYILDQSNMAKDFMMASVILDVERIYRQKVLEVENGNFKPGVWTVGLKDGYLDLRSFHKKVPIKIQDEISQLREQALSEMVEYT